MVYCVTSGPLKAVSPELGHHYGRTNQQTKSVAKMHAAFANNERVFDPSGHTSTAQVN